MTELSPNQRYWLAQAAMGFLVYDTEAKVSYRYDEWDWNNRIVDPDFLSLIRLGLIKHDDGYGRCSWDSTEFPRTRR
ncbi:MAG TPA: hypothetical protein VI172_08110 [Candidatus Dormibacteraeota bacterium]